jgi:hypothetical protein
MSVIMANFMKSSLRVQRPILSFSPVTFPRASFSSKNPNFSNDMILLNGIHDGAAAHPNGHVSVEVANEMLAKIKSFSGAAAPLPAGRKFIIAYTRAEYTWAPEADAAFRRGMIDWNTEKRAIARLDKIDKKATKVK